MAMVGAITLGATLAGGSSLHAILNAIVLQNGHFIRNWYIPMPYSSASIAAGAMALFAALFTRRARSRPYAEKVIAVLKLVAGACGILWLLPMTLGSSEWWDTRLVMIQFVTPFSFLLLFPADRRSTMGAGRISFGLLATFMVLYAFPVASDQIVTAVSLSVASLPLLFREGMLALRPPLADRPALQRTSTAALGWLLVALCFAGLLNRTRHAWWEWGGGVSADLPGTNLIHVSPLQRDALHWVVQQLTACPALYTFPGVMSFYLWTDRPSPTALNNNDTLGLLTASQQDRVLADLAHQPALCIVFTPELLRSFDRGQVASRPPLLRYVDENYSNAGEYGPYVILTPKGH